MQGPHWNEMAIVLLYDDWEASTTTSRRRWSANAAVS